MMKPGSAASHIHAGVAADLRLPRPPGVFRRFWGRHPFLVDCILAGAYLLPSLILILVDIFAGFNQLPEVSTSTPDGEVMTAEVGGEAPPPTGLSSPIFFAWHSLVIAALTITIIFRRRFPQWGITVACVAMFTINTSYGGVDLFAVMILLYTLPLYRMTRVAWIGYGALVASAFLGSLLRLDDLLSALRSTASVAPILVIVLLIGINIGNRRRYLSAIIDRAAQLARERDQQALLAASEERARIAREMHDIVAHSLSVMIALADGAAAAATRNSEAAQKAMLASAETGRSALTEMRRLLGVLSAGQEESDESLERVPQPGAENIVPMMETFRSAGLAVRYRVSGVPAADLGQQLAVYRVIQESLTNSLRYAGIGAGVDVSVEFNRTETRVIVTDDGSGTPVAGDLGSGRGLAGIRQRVGIFGGQVIASPHGRGWRVDATIPVGSSAPDAGSIVKGSE